ncbi:alpha-ketoglutarate-dependent dioxygenase AlkB family protein [Azorhizobium doebereinerae]|uniref:alpha-ketoglutarate-dependent dioxygenase AlkB family protein n=1 Tax=Azorhizobium doebereinerae TaxID=281091 RepID=UPI000419CF1E|nr:alpha-ketoglutarate-dependent dioxygenase AlkB [Azorhizobium doebereinerae]
MPQRLEIAPDCLWWPGYLDRPAQEALLADVRAVLEAAPLFAPAMPRSGKPLSVKMSNCGPLGWVADVSGYRYQAFHPDTRQPWPAIPARLLALWDALTGFPAPPEACLINWYGPEARMGLHQDRDEQDLTAPVLSLSLGDTALFRIGGENRSESTHSVRLASGDAVLLSGRSRLAFHGVDRILPGSSTLLGAAGRINLTLRRVTPSATV